MNKNRNLISSIIANIIDNTDYGTIDIESLKRQVEDEMKKQEIEKKYGKQIKQISTSGQWWIRLEDGKVVKRTTKEAVLSKLLELERNEPTLESFWDTFFEHRKISRSDGTNRIDLRYFNRYIKPTAISKIPFSKIRLTDVEAWVTECFKINPNMTGNYFNGVSGTLSQMFQYAIKCKLMAHNFVEDITVHRDNFHPRKKHKETDGFFLPEEENAVKRLAYEDSKRKNNSLPLAIPFLFQTGIRDGELCGLHWRDIEGNYLHVQSEIIEKMDKDGNFDGYKWVDHCKSKAGDRFVPLNSEARKILMEVKKINLSNGLPITQDDFIFLRTRKKEITFCTTRSFEPRIKKYCKYAGMDVLKSQHDARRTFATNLYYIGMPIKNISQIMGHETIEQTEAYIKCRPMADVFDFMEQLSNRNKMEQIGTEFPDTKKAGNA